MVQQGYGRRATGDDQPGPQERQPSPGGKATTGSRVRNSATVRENVACDSVTPLSPFRQQPTCSLSGTHILANNGVEPKMNKFAASCIEHLRERLVYVGPDDREESRDAL